MKRNCGNCWHFARKYFLGRDCCIVDEDNEEGTIHYAKADDEPCGQWELDLADQR